jgi:hypothetical protein
MSGHVILWDMRAAIPSDKNTVNTVYPVRIISTKSPQISSLALSSLYIVHGGNDGLVQAWDPLASTHEPIRTLNSRFSDRARRRIAQADASAQGVGHNYFAAAAILLDPDPTVLRGMVSLGTHLRYWSYSSTAADAYKTRKRGQLRRRSERGSHSASVDHKVTATGRGVIKDYILNEQIELEREKVASRKEQERLTGRFGTDILGAGASEEELLAYATLLSEEAWASDEAKRQSEEVSATATPIKASRSQAGGSDDPELEEAIRRGLMAPEEASSPSTGSFDVPVRYSKALKRATASPRAKSGASKGREPLAEDADLEYALQLSLAEERSRLDEVNFPSLPKSPSSDSDRQDHVMGKGKGKGKGRGARS